MSCNDLQLGMCRSSVSDPLQLALGNVQVVHRDFKTSNILVDAKWNGVVADFGLARRMKSRGGAVHEPLPPECTVVMGTFGYVAPEYARTGVLCARALATRCRLVCDDTLTCPRRALLAQQVDSRRAAIANQAHPSHVCRHTQREE
jgi:serine/threonine protein kinase